MLYPSRQHGMLCIILAWCLLPTCPASTLQDPPACCVLGSAESSQWPAPIRSHGASVVQVECTVPPQVPISPSCRDLLTRILVAEPSARVTVQSIQAHPWYRMVNPWLRAASDAVEVVDDLTGIDSASSAVGRGPHQRLCSMAASMAAGVVQ